MNKRNLTADQSEAAPAASAPDYVARCLLAALRRSAPPDVEWTTAAKGRDGWILAGVLGSRLVGPVTMPPEAIGQDLGSVGRLADAVNARVLADMASGATPE